MRELQNVLYVTTQGLTLRLEHDAVKVVNEDEMVARFPLMGLAGIVLFGRIHVTSSLIHRCAEDGRSVVWLTSTGRFRARLQGPTRGNVLLRRAQHLALSDTETVTAVARQIVAAKIQNSRQVLLRGARDALREEIRVRLADVGAALENDLAGLATAQSVDTVRGFEGIAASRYFSCLTDLIHTDRDKWSGGGRNRRPPRDPLNAMLSFLYALLRAECEAALEGVGLDPQVGYLHTLRPGRPGLALDLMEELRPIIDRLVITLINRRQIVDSDFDVEIGSTVYLSEAGRRTIISAWQRRKEVEVPHRLLDSHVPIGLVPHIQARVLARHLRGDMGTYIPFLYR